MFDREHYFWTCGHRYEALAREYEQNIERVHPGSVTSNRLSPYSAYGIWNTTAVTYYDYRGPRV